jgi:hypothetical protein
MRKRTTVDSSPPDGLVGADWRRFLSDAEWDELRVLEARLRKVSRERELARRREARARRKRLELSRQKDRLKAAEEALGRGDLERGESLLADAQVWFRSHGKTRSHNGAPLRRGPRARGAGRPAHRRTSRSTSRGDPDDEPEPPGRRLTSRDEINRSATERKAALDRLTRERAPLGPFGEEAA